MTERDSLEPACPPKDGRSNRQWDGSPDQSQSRMILDGSDGSDGTTPAETIGSRTRSEGTIDG